MVLIVMFLAAAIYKDCSAREVHTYQCSRKHTRISQRPTHAKIKLKPIKNNYILNWNHDIGIQFNVLYVN